ncbi:hypothetical protein LYZ91_22745, partial [Xanthomonas hortorum pv. vitians]|nr:hypothetical protein [Xanthomonas hortorum pv. vitians]MCE4369445.1 hypothetical protein [Xanthomonas hortorum pv. vitians]
AFGFAQKADDLLVSKTFLHVQSPRGRELDSKLRRYSKLGGRRRQVVGWAMRDRADTELVVQAVLSAVWRRKPNAGCLVHSDQGS